MTLDYSKYCLGPATQTRSGLDNGDGGGTAADGQLHDGEIDESKLSCQTAMMVKDVNDGDGDVIPLQLTPVGNNMFFVADNGINGFELWKSDGTISGTAMVKDINNGSGYNPPWQLTVLAAHPFLMTTDQRIENCGRVTELPQAL